jgi:homoserine O-acetyltransferase
MACWRSGDPIGERRFATVFADQPLKLECGEHFGPITLAYESWGELNHTRSNAILLLHGFTGDSHAAGSVGPGHGQVGWWDGLIGPGRPLDTNSFFVLCPNAFGGCHGSTGPGSLAPDGTPYGSRFPTITIRDLVATEIALAEQLGITTWHAVVGGSMGGMRALEWAIARPHAVNRLMVMATTAYATAEQIALHHAQIRAIALDPHFRGGDYDQDGGQEPRLGLSLARSLAVLSYGYEREFAGLFHRRPEGDNNPLSHGRYAIEAYLDEDGDWLAQRFDANSYIALTKAMSHHDVGRGRGGVEQALTQVKARTRIVSIRSDRLFPPRLQLEMAQALRCGVTFTTIDSNHGHDGFLHEHRQLAPVIREMLG